MKAEENVDNIRLKTMSKSYVAASEYQKKHERALYFGILVRTLDSHTKVSFIAQCYCLHPWANCFAHNVPTRPLGEPGNIMGCNNNRKACRKSSIIDNVAIPLCEVEQMFTV